MVAEQITKGVGAASVYLDFTLFPEMKLKRGKWSARPAQAVRGHEEGELREGCIGWVFCGSCCWKGS